MAATNRAEDNTVKLLRRIEDLGADEQKALGKEFKETTSAKYWTKLNILSIFQSLFWIALFLVASFLDWHHVAVTLLLVMMVLQILHTFPRPRIA